MPKLMKEREKTGMRIPNIPADDNSVVNNDIGKPGVVNLQKKHAKLIRKHQAK